MEDNFERQYFEYVINRTVPANAVQDPNILTILSDADFEWWWIKISRTSALLTVLLKEMATGRDFFAQSPAVPGVAFNGINVDNLAGTAQVDAAWPLAVPFLMPAGRTYLVSLTDTSGAPNVVQMTFSGFKMFPKAAA